MAELQLKDRVVIRDNGIEGEVRGIWIRVGGDPLYNIRYVTTTKAVCDDWLTADQIEAITAASPVN